MTRGKSVWRRVWRPDADVSNAVEVDLFAPLAPVELAAGATRGNLFEALTTAEREGLNAAARAANGGRGRSPVDD